MNNKQMAVLHISDLHIFDPDYSDFNNRLDSDSYLTALSNKLAEKYRITNLIVSGDITNSGKCYEYDKASKVLNKLCDLFSIEKDHVLIVPGNHDIDWEAYKERCRLKHISRDNVSDYQEEKFYEYKYFYDAFFDGIKCFDANRVICDKIVDDSEITFVGINTIHKESFLNKDHVGFVDPSLLDEELNEERLEENTVFLIFHHTDKILGNFSEAISNWNDIKPILEKHKIHRFLFGHSHSSSSMEHKYNSDEDYSISTGSFGICDQDIHNDVLVLPICEDNGKRVIHPIYYRWQIDRESNYWQELSDKPDTVTSIPLGEHYGNSTLEEFIRESEPSKLEKVENLPKIEELYNDTYKDSLENKLMKIIKDNHLYISGHFHWSATGKSQSFLKTDYFFENREGVEVAKRCYTYMLDQHDGLVSILLGYGMQGNSMGVLLALKYGWDYSYYPAFGQEFSCYEKNLPAVDATDLIIIIDIIYTDNIVHWFTGKDSQLRRTYPNLRKVTFYALFSTIEESDKCFEENGINYSIHAFCKLQINKCCIDANKCEIFKNQLDEVHILYSSDIGC